MNNAPNIIISAEAPENPGAMELIHALDAELLMLYPAESVHNLDYAETQSEGGTFLVARQGGEALACGGMRRIDADCTEIKRVYVAQAARGLGLGRQIVERLETAARDIGYTRIKLETGTRQTAAQALYTSMGYTVIQCFGEYATDPYSVCMEKKL